MKYGWVVLFFLLGCGESSYNDSWSQRPSENGIVGGREVQNSEDLAKYVVRIGIQRAGGARGTCTGTHITEDLILTAAHCFTERYQALWADYKTEGWFESSSRDIKKVWINEGFYRDASIDLAIVQIEGRLPKNQKIFSLSTERSLAEGSPVLTLGYGATDLRKLRRAAPRGVGYLRAVELFTLPMDLVKDPNTLNTDMQQGRGVNVGDSGGPALRFVNGEYTLVGVTRSVIARKMGDEDIYDQFSTFVFVPNQRLWIHKIMREGKKKE